MFRSGKRILGRKSSAALRSMKIGRVEDRLRFTLLAFRPKVTGAVGKKCLNEKAAMRTIQVALGQLQTFRVGALHLFMHFRRHGLHLIRQRGRPHGHRPLS